MERICGISKVDTTADGSSSSNSMAEGEEEPDEPSSSKCLASELDSFRQKWKQEITNANLKYATEDEENCDGNLKDVEALFQRGVQEEKIGNFSKAIYFYRRAVQLDPDVEYKLAKRDEQSLSLNDDFPSQSEIVLQMNKSGEVSVESSEDEGLEEINQIEEGHLEGHLERILVGHRICRPARKIKGTHLSELPPEVFSQILRWVVSADLDCHSLEQVAMVCRGFYLRSRDPALWRLACLRVWGMSCGLPNKYGSWRNMFIYRPHLWFHGAYISKTTYVRYGESSFQDSNYRPCYIVEYYRYLRFFPEGIVLMLTTPDGPYQSLSKLRHRGQHPHVLTGHYWLKGGTSLSAILQRSKSGMDPNYRAWRRKALPEPQEETYHIELDIRPVKQRPNFKLTWSRYSLHRTFRSGEETISNLETTPTSFPPFWFSRVRSFNSDSQSPLQ